MTSAFTPPTTTTTTAPLVLVTEAVVPQQQQITPWEESETEDEEVKLNCVRGLNAAEESDMTNPVFDDEDDDDETSSYGGSNEQDDDLEDVRRQDVRLGVVHFVARVPRPNPRLICPAASRRRRCCPTLSPCLELHQEQLEQDNDDDDDNELEEAEQESYVGARGVALELESENDDEEEHEENDCDDSPMEQESVSGSDADESDMEEDDDEEELDDEDDDDEEQDTSAEAQQEPSLTLERPVFAQDTADCIMPEEETTASVILQALQQDQDDEEISSLIDSVQEQQEEQDATLMPLMPLYQYNKDNTTSTTHTTHLIGVAKDRQEHAASVPRVKRVLSADPEQVVLRGDASSLSGTTLILPKKRRKSESDQDLLSFSLGLPALTLLQPQQEEDDDKTEPSVAVVPTGRFLSPIISSSEELEEEEELLDGQLRYELESTTSLSVEGGDNLSPVPLLTPPESPVLCEWPSNLVVDSAMTAVLATRFRPIDDDVWSEDEEEITTCPTFKALTTNTTSSPSLLTPLMRGIKVCDPFQGRRR